jgi:hypothetical protein
MSIFSKIKEMFIGTTIAENNSTNIDRVETIIINPQSEEKEAPKHSSEKLATADQRKYCYALMKTMLERHIDFPSEITSYYIYHLMTFKEAYTFIERYKYVFNH